MNKNILKNRKAILSAALVIAATASAFAQGNGIAGINEATSMVSSYFDPGTKLIYAIGAVVGLIGGVNVNIKKKNGKITPHWNDGDDFPCDACIMQFLRYLTWRRENLTLATAVLAGCGVILKVFCGCCLS